MADHGFPNMSNPIFLMKSSKVNSGFYINDSPISHRNLHASIMNELNIDYAEYGSSVFDEDNKENIRKFMYYNWDDSWDKKYLPDIYEYEIENESNKMENFYTTDNVYTENGTLPINRDYNLNDIVLFNGDICAKYFLHGISYIEKDFAWTSGKRGKIKFHIDNFNNSDLKFKLQIGWILGERQKLKISNKDKVLYEGTITGAESVEFLVPKECIVDNKLLLDLEYPDAISPMELGVNEDPRQLAFALISMCIEEINED